MKILLTLSLFFSSLIFASAEIIIVETAVFRPTAQGVQIVLKGNKKEGYSIDIRCKLRVTAPVGTAIRMPLSRMIVLEVIDSAGRTFKSVDIGSSNVTETHAEKRSSHFYFTPNGKGVFLTFGRVSNLPILAFGEYKVVIREINYQTSGVSYTFKPTEVIYSGKVVVPQ